MRELWEMSVRLLNDFKHIHWHASGEHFFEVHNLAEEYYKHLNEDVDFLAESTMQTGEKLPNASLLLQDKSWKVANMEDYDLADAVPAIRDRLERFTRLINNKIETEQDAGIKSELENMLLYWGKELNYKLKRM